VEEEVENDENQEQESDEVSLDPEDLDEQYLASQRFKFEYEALMSKRRSKSCFQFQELQAIWEEDMGDLNMSQEKQKTQTAHL